MESVEEREDDRLQAATLNSTLSADEREGVFDGVGYKTLALEVIEGKGLLVPADGG